MPLKFKKVQDSEHYLVLCDDDWYRVFSYLELCELGLEKVINTLERWRNYQRNCECGVMACKGAH